MVTRCGNFQGALGITLSFHVSKLGAATLIPGQLCAGRERNWLPPGEVLGHIAQARCTNDFCTGERRLGRICLRHNDPVPYLMRLDDCRQQPDHRTQVTIQRKLPIALNLLQCIDRKLLAGRKNAQCDSKIKSTARLAHFCGAKADRDALLWKLEARAHQRATNAILTLAYRRLGQADNRKRGQTSREENFDRDRGCLGAVLGTATQYREVHPALLGHAGACLARS